MDPRVKRLALAALKEGSGEVEYRLARRVEQENPFLEEVEVTSLIGRTLEWTDVESSLASELSVGEPSSNGSLDKSFGRGPLVGVLRANGSSVGIHKKLSDDEDSQAVRYVAEQLVAKGEELFPS